MTKRDWFWVISTIFFVWGSDQLSKQWAVENLTGLQFYGPFGLVLHRNPGAILGAFSDLPPLLRIVSLSTGGAFLIFLYGAFQYLLPKRSFVLRLGMSILLGGILGNVSDRIVHGSVVDFLLVGTPKFSSPAFNLADALQWVGYGMIVVSLLKEGGSLWPNENERKNIWILPTFQLKYCFVLMFIGFGFAVIAGVFSYTFLLITIDELVLAQSKMVEKRFLIPFLEVYSLITVGFIVTLFLIGRVLSLRTAGPLYAFELFISDLLKGKDRPLKLRAGDEFKHLEELAEKVRTLVAQLPKEALATIEVVKSETESTDSFSQPETVLNIAGNPLLRGESGE